MPPNKQPLFTKIDPVVKADAQAICEHYGVSLASVIEKQLLRYNARHRHVLTSKGASKS